VRTAKLQDGTLYTFYVESAGARKLVKWETSAGERAELLGSDRMKYWEMNKEGGEQALKRMGLTPPAGRFTSAPEDKHNSPAAPSRRPR
jgi:hypothetical protein